LHTNPPGIQSDLEERAERRLYCTTT